MSKRPRPVQPEDCTFTIKADGSLQLFGRIQPEPLLPRPVLAHAFPRPMKECLECRRLEIKIKNLDQGFGVEKLKAVAGAYTTVEKDRKYELLLRLSHELEALRREYKQHLKTHFSLIKKPPAAR